MSALPPEADMLVVGINVCYVPQADMGLLKALDPSCWFVRAATCRGLLHSLERKSIHEAVIANSAARGRSVRARVDLAGVNEEREGSGRRKIHLNDNRRTTALLARNW